jgi:hypothetical protein
MKKVSVILASLLALPVIAFGVTTLVADSASAQLNLESGINSAKGTGAPDNVTEDDGLIKKVVNLLLWAIGIISVIMIIIGGIRYATSNGDSNQVTAAKNTIMYAVIGLVIAIFAYAIVNFVLFQTAGIDASA